MSPKQESTGLMSAEQAAEYTGLSVWTIRDYTSRRKIPHVRIGRRVLFRKSDLDNWIEDRSVAVIDY